MHEERVRNEQMGELNYFLGLQIQQKGDGIFVNQVKYTRELIKKFGLEEAKMQNSWLGKNVDNKNLSWHD